MKTKAKSLMLILCTAVLMLSVGIVSALAAGTNKAADKGTINVYLIAGQSNAVGYGDGAPTSGDPRFTEGFDNTIYYGLQENNDISDFVPVKVGLGKDKNSVGAEIGIASMLADSGEMNAVIKCAWGATFLYPALSESISTTSGTWTSPSYIAMANDNTAGSPGASVADIDLTKKIASGRFSGEVMAGNMYNQFLKKVTEGLNLLKEDGYTPVIKGIWWMQGEAEVFNKTMANEYATLLDYLIKDMRSDISDITGEDYSDLPFAMGKVNRNGGIDYTTGKIYSQPGYIETVRGAMQTATDNGKNVFAVECRGLAQLDGWHFSSDAQKWIGEQYVNAVRTAEGNVVTDYGTITPEYADQDKYPFALFENDEFIGAYETLTDACKKASSYNSETQVLLRDDVTVSGVNTEFKSINLDLDGHTLTANGTVFSKGSISIQNGKIVLGNADFIKMTSNTEGAAKVSIENCTFDFTDAASGVCVVNTADTNNVYDVDVTIRGGKIVANDFSKYSFYKMGDGDSIKFDKYNDKYIEMTLPSSAAAPTGTYPTDNGNAKFVVVKTTDSAVTYTLSVLEIPGYGTIDEAYQSVEKYPFAIFFDGEFVSAHENWNSAGQAARNLIAGSANKSKTAYVLLRRDYDVTTRFYNTSQIGGTLVLDLNGYTMTGTDTIIDGTAKTIGTSSEICDTYMKVMNGSLLAKNKPIIYFNRNTDTYVSEKTFYFTFDNVVIGLAENYTEGVNVLCAAGANQASAKAYADITLNDCTFDLTALGQTSAVTLFAAKDEHNQIDVDITVKGGSMLCDEIDRVVWQNVDSGNDKVVFAKGSEGAYLKLYNKIKNADAPHYSVAFYNDKNHELTFTRVVADGNDAVYELKESETTPYGLLPDRYTVKDAYPFVVFDKKGEFLGAYSAWLGINGNGSVLQKVRGYLDNAWDGTSYGNDPKEAFILMRRDYTMDSSKDTAYENLAQSQGTINIDLGGFTLSTGSVKYSLFPAYSKAYTGAAGNIVFPTNLIISNGTLRHCQNGIVGMKTWDSTHDGQVANKEFNFTFNNVTFGFVDGANSVGLVAHALSPNNSGGAPTVAAPFNITYNDCIFDVKTTKSSFNSATLFSTTNENYVKVTHKVNGGVVKTGGSAITFYNTGNSYGSSVTFERGSDGKYLSYIAPSTLAVTSDAFPSSSGSLYMTRAGVSGNDVEYVLDLAEGSGLATKYGVVPNDKLADGQMFAVFAKKANDSSYTFINTYGSMKGGAIYWAKEQVKRNSGTYAGGTVIICMLKDYAYTTGGNGDANFNEAMQIDGTMLIDLGGYHLTISKPRLLGFEAKSDSIIGTASSYTSALRFVNGTISSDTPVVEVFGGNSTYTGTKSVEIGFEDITFEPKSGSDTRKIVISRNSFKSGQSVDLKLNYTNCTFNYASSGVALYDDTATGDNSNPVVADVKVNGGSVQVADLSKFITRTDTAHDSVTFGKNGSGARTTFTLNYADSAPTTAFTTDAGTMYLASEAVDKDMIAGTAKVTYSLSNVKAGNYGYIPLSKTNNAFSVFHNNLHVGSYDNLNNASTGAMNAVKNMVFGGNTKGALAGKTLVVYMNKDYEDNVTSNRFANYAQMEGTVVLDLGGHTITEAEGTYLFNLTAKAVDGKLPTTSTTVKNGKILTRSDAIMKVQSGSNFEYNGTKTFNFTYDNVTFDKHTSKATYYAPIAQVVSFSDNGGTKNVAFNATFNNCTFNSKDSVLFNCATSNYVDANFTINGGSLTSHTMDAAGLMKTSNSEDKLTFGQNANGERTTFTLDYAESAPTVAFTTDEGKMGLASEPLTKDIISAKSPISYTLSNVKAGDNGYIPINKAGNTFYVFYNNLYVGTYSHLNANGGAMDTVKGLLFGGKTPGVLYEKTLTIYANKDYDDTVESGRFANFAQIGGHVVLDLGGHTIKQTSGNYCFNLTSKAVDGKLPVTSATVKNGTILTTLEPIMKIQSPDYFSYDGIKTYNFTYENVTFDRAPEVTNYTAIANVATFVDNDGTKNVDFNATFNNCTFKSANSVLFDFALCDYVDADITINGGSLIAQSMGDTGVMKISDSDDKFTFGQYEGEYMTLQLAKNVSTPTVTFNNGALEFTLVSETADATNFKLISTDKTAALKSYSPKMSLTLDSTLKMNVYVPQELTKTFEIDGVADEYDAKVTLTDGKVYYRKTVELTSSDAIRNVVLKVTVSTGEKDVKGTFTFSVPKYANRIFESGNGVEKQLIRDVLSYVRAAYQYFKPDETQSIAQIDALIGTYYEQMTPFTPDAVAVNPTSFKAATFQLAGTPAFRFYLNSGDDASKYTFKIAGEDVNAVLGSDSNGEYLQIAVYAYQMCEKITYFANGTEVGSYHLSSYYDWAKTQNNTSVVNVVERFWAYCQSARDYKNSVEIQIKYVDEAGKELAKSYTNSYKLGEEFTVLSPAVEGYYTRDVYKTASATSNAVIKVVYKKIPSNINASTASAKLPNIAAWGDSITAGGSAYNTTVANQYSIDLTALGSSAGGGTYAEILQNLIAGRVYSGIEVANCGVGGESTATITARANAENYYLYLGTGVTIGSQPVVIDLQQEYPDTLNPGRLGVLRTSLKDSLSHVTIVDKNGTSITGVITCEVTPSIPASETYKDVWNCDVKYLVYTFTRTDGKTNDVKLSADARVIMNAAVDYDGRTCIIFMGENNGYSNKGTVDRDVKILIAQQKEILKACGNPEEFLIISSTSGSNETRKGITEALTKEWGDRYINMGNELNSSRKSYEFVGYSEADIVSVQENIVNGTVTPLLLNDGCHPHAVGYTVVGNVIFERMFKLGMFDELFDYYDSLQK